VEQNSLTRTVTSEDTIKETAWRPAGGLKPTAQRRALRRVIPVRNVARASPKEVTFVFLAPDEYPTLITVTKAEIQ